MDRANQLIHGGQLEQQAHRFAIAKEKWLDLSTGISPYSYPVNNIPEVIWQRLPEISTQLQQIVSRYYANKQFVICPGSQAAIQLLPKLWYQDLSQRVPLRSVENPTVWLPICGYKEHLRQWRHYGFECLFYSDLCDLNELETGSVVVVINPNNPTGKIYHKKQLLELSEFIAKRQGLLIVDEAFVESCPEQSITRAAGPHQHLIVLRSIGKFFGLAGIRMGFCFASTTWCERIHQALGEWPLTGPSLYIAEQALGDSSWQELQSKKLQQQSQKMNQLLEAFFDRPTKGTILFRSLMHEDAGYYFEQLAKRAIYVRLMDEKNGLRFGITDDSGLARLQNALADIQANC